MTKVGWMKLLTVTVMLMASGAVADAELLAISGKVVDIEGNPLAGVELVASAEDSSRTYDVMTKKKGRFVIRVPESQSALLLRARLEGYRDVELELWPTPDGRTVVDITMEEASEPAEEAASAQESAAEVAPAAPQMSEKRMAAIAIFNEGVLATQGGDDETAMAKFEEAAAIDPEFPETLGALAGIALENKDYERAAEASEKLLLLLPDDLRVHQMAYVAHFMTGNVERLVLDARRLVELDPAIVERDMIRNARSRFEADDYSVSRALLEVIVAARPDLAEAQLLLGMCCNADGDSDCARKAFGNFLELAPEHPEAETARSLLEYLE